MTQSLTPDQLTELPMSLGEVSGVLLNGTDHWILLDSGNGNRLYRVDPVSGDVLQEVTLLNASNVDWEEITTDGTWVYVADIGNNAGARTDLRIYRFPLAELTPTAVNLFVDTIQFHYDDQTDFTPAYDDTNWDCEAMIALDDSLFLFTKNWLDGHTHLYALPALPGEHAAIRRDELNAQGLITGAARDPVSATIALLGHTEEGMEPMVWVLRGHVGHAFFSGMNEFHPLTIAPLQAEAIEFESSHVLIIGNESSPTNPAALWRLLLPTASDRDRPGEGSVHLFPVPADRCVQVVGADVSHEASLIDPNGALLARLVVSSSGFVDLSGWAPGKYLLEVMVGIALHRLPLIIVH